MFVDKWRPLYAPETEAGTGESDNKAPQHTEGQEDNRRLGGRSELRKQLEKGFEEDRKGTDRSDGRNAEGRFARGAASKERTEETEDEPETRAEGQEPETQEAEGEQQEQVTEEQEAAAKAAGTAPDGWAKEAKSEWAKLPSAVQTAVKKRETDMAKGVEDLKGRYRELDQALQPHMETIRRHGHTPGKAVAQLFAWFSALTANPQAAFPALAKSFGHEPQQVMEWMGGKPAEGKAAEAATVEQPAEGDLPPALQKYIQGLQTELQGLKGEITQKFGTLESNFAASSQQKAEETLAIWSKDKPHFDKVRGIMSELIGRGLVPLKEGKYVDLDAAYDKALYYDPAIREEVLAEQRKSEEDKRKAKEAAEKKAQQERADKARRANVGLGPSSPGTAVAQDRKTAKGKSVRDSLHEAIEASRS